MNGYAGQEVLERNIRRTSLLGALGLLLVVVALVVSLVQLSRINDRAEVLQGQVEEMEASVDSLADMRRGLLAQADSLRRMRDSLQFVVDNLAQRVSPEAVEEAQNVAEAELPQRPAIYLHVWSRQQAARVEAVEAELRREGYSVRETQVVRTGPSRTQVRYFIRSQANEARYTARLLGQMGYSAEVVQMTAARPYQHLEVWFAP